MKTWNHYFIPQTLQDALRVLNQCAPGSARLIAGGTDLLLELQQGHLPPIDTLVDINQIPEMICLEPRQNELFIGAAVPLKKVATSELVQQNSQALAEAAGMVGGPQVRNQATLGGNVSHALPAADGTIALTALGAEAEIISLNGTRRIPLKDLFKGPGQSTLDPQGEIVVGFYLRKAAPGQASAFWRVMRPQGVALPVLNMACWLERSGDEVTDVQIAVGPSGPTPKRNAAAEVALRGKPFNAETCAQAMEALLVDARFRTSPRRAGAEYRKDLSAVLLDEVLHRAWQRAGESLAQPA